MSFYKVVASGGVRCRRSRGGESHSDHPKLEYGAIVEAKEIVKGWARLERGKWLRVKEKSGSRILRELNSSKKLFKVTAECGVAYRNTKNKNDRVTTKRGPEGGTIIEANEVFQGWIRTQNGYYIPTGLGSGMERLRTPKKRESRREKSSRSKPAEREDTPDNSGLKTSHRSDAKKKKKKKKKRSDSDSSASDSSSDSSARPQISRHMAKKLKEEKRREDRFWGKSSARKSKKKGSKKRSSKDKPSLSPVKNLGDSDEDFEVLNGVSLPSSPVTVKTRRGNESKSSKKKRKSRRRRDSSSSRSPSPSRSASPPKKRLPTAVAAPIGNLLDFGSGPPSQQSSPVNASSAPSAQKASIGNFFGSGNKSDSEPEQAPSSTNPGATHASQPAQANVGDGILDFLGHFGSASPSAAVSAPVEAQFNIESVLKAPAPVSPEKPKNQAQSQAVLDLFAPAPEAAYVPAPGPQQLLPTHMAPQPQILYSPVMPAPHHAGPMMGMPHTPPRPVPNAMMGSPQRHGSGSVMTFPSPKATRTPAVTEASRKREGAKKAKQQRLEGQDPQESLDDLFKNSLNNLHFGHSGPAFRRTSGQHQKQWKPGDVAMRKGQMCTIVTIDESTRPPSATVRMHGINTEANTELHLLSAPRNDQPTLSLLSGDVSLTGLG